jgi:hypothetical protein
LSTPVPEPRRQPASHIEGRATRVSTCAHAHTPDCVAGTSSIGQRHDLDDGAAHLLEEPVQRRALEEDLPARSDPGRGARARADHHPIRHERRIDGLFDLLRAVFSVVGGKPWEANRISDITRAEDAGSQ